MGKPCLGFGPGAPDSRVSRRKITPPGKRIAKQVRTLPKCTRHTEEWVCTAKTREELYAPLEQAIRELHPYETPAIVATPIVAGSPSYLAWIEAETSTPIS